MVKYDALVKANHVTNQLLDNEWLSMTFWPSMSQRSYQTADG